MNNGFRLSAVRTSVKEISGAPSQHRTRAIKNSDSPGSAVAAPDICATKERNWESCSGVV